MSGKFNRQIAVVTGGYSSSEFAIAQGQIAEAAKRVYISGRSARTLDPAIECWATRLLRSSPTSRGRSILMSSRRRSAQGDQLDAVFANAGNLQLSAHASKPQDFYSRQFLGLTYNMPVGPDKAFTDLPFFRAKQIGQEKLGEVDNRVVSSNFGYQMDDTHC